MRKREKKCEEIVMSKVAVPLFVSGTLLGYNGYVKLCAAAIASSFASIATSCVIVWVKEYARNNAWD